MPGISGEPATAPRAERAEEASHLAEGTVPLRYDAASGALPPFPRFADVDLPHAPAVPLHRPAATPQLASRAALALALPDGERIPMTTPVVLGRNPAAEQFPGEEVRALQDPTRTMSKTHARVTPVNGQLTVDDLNSTNGVAVLPQGSLEHARAVDPGTPLAAQPGDVIQLGEYPIVVEALSSGV